MKKPLDDKLLIDEIKEINKYLKSFKLTKVKAYAIHDLLQATLIKMFI